MIHDPKLWGLNIWHFNNKAKYCVKRCRKKKMKENMDNDDYHDGNSTEQCRYRFLFGNIIARGREDRMIK